MKGHAAVSLSSVWAGSQAGKHPQICRDQIGTCSALVLLMGRRFAGPMSQALSEKSCRGANEVTFSLGTSGFERISACTEVWKWRG